MVTNVAQLPCALHINQPNKGKKQVGTMLCQPQLKLLIHFLGNKIFSVSLTFNGYNFFVKKFGTLKFFGSNPF